MAKGSIFLSGCLVCLTVTAAYANPSGVWMSGDLRITGSGNRLVFADGTFQTTAAPPAAPASLSMGTVTTGAPGSSASATITGTAPSQTLNLVIPQGPQGPAGAGTCSSIKMVWTHQTNITKGVAPVGATAYNTVSEIRNAYDSQGKSTGWVQTGANVNNQGAITPMGIAAYYTAFDGNGGATDGYAVMTPSATYRITATYTYDNDGHRTQRVRTWYNPDGSTYRVQTTNYGTHMALLSDISEYFGANPTTNTTTYSNTQFDGNNYPSMADITTTNAAGTVTNTGTVLYGWTPYCITAN